MVWCVKITDHNLLITNDKILKSYELPSCDFPYQLAFICSLSRSRSGVTNHTLPTYEHILMQLVHYYPSLSKYNS